jgi:FSR family fosmidomycin resistance protein-like MFS transporter
MLQPVVGFYADRKPQPYSAVLGMTFTLSGLVVLALASSFTMLILGASLIGTGSSVFHPEATRMARAASGGRFGFAQSLFQVGGQTGQAIGPLLAAFIVAPRGQASLLWFSFAALIGMVVLFKVGSWYAATSAAAAAKSGAGSKRVHDPLPRAIMVTIVVLLALMFSKSAYTSSISNFLTFYLIDKFGLSVQSSQLLLFVFLLSQVAGSLVGGHWSDRIGRRKIIWFSILGALPFTLILPHVGFALTVVLLILIGMIMASAFPAMLTYILEMMPTRVGVVAGLFFGAAFGLGGLSAALLGRVADATSLTTVYELCSLLPLIGLATWFLPRMQSASRI